MEKEYYSICCYAPPLYELRIEEDVVPIGKCMKCRDNSGFELGEEEKEVKKVMKKEVLALFDDVFNAHLGIKINKEKE